MPEAVLFCRGLLELILVGCAFYCSTIVVIHIRLIERKAFGARELFSCELLLVKQRLERSFPSRRRQLSAADLVGGEALLTNTHLNSRVLLLLDCLQGFIVILSFELLLSYHNHFWI